MRKIILPTLVFLLEILGLHAQNTGFENLDPEAFASFIRENEGIQLLDVRTSEEHLEGHIAGCIQIDWKRDDFMEIALKVLQKEKPVALYCKGGVRGRAAAQKLSEAGFLTIVNLDKGFDSWKEAGKPQQR